MAVSSDVVTVGHHASELLPPVEAIVRAQLACERQLMIVKQRTDLCL